MPGKIPVVDVMTNATRNIDIKYFNENKEKFVPCFNKNGTIVCINDEGKSYRVTKKEYDSGGHVSIYKNTVAVRDKDGIYLKVDSIDSIKVV